MSILILILLLLGLRIGGVDPETITGEPPDWPAVTVRGHAGVVAPRHAAEDLVWSGDPVDGYWLPGEDWLTRAEDAVARDAAAIPEEERTPVLSGYRQYAGFIVDGERKILINSMCREFDGWRSSAIMVMDGGPCFWTAIYNADTDQIESLIVNGQA